MTFRMYGNGKDGDDDNKKSSKEEKKEDPGNYDLGEDMGGHSEKGHDAVEDAIS